MIRSKNARLVAALLAAVLVFSSSAPVYAADDDKRAKYSRTKVTGTLVYEKTTQPIPGATIRLENADEEGDAESREARTDANGKFEIKDLAYGLYAVSIQTTDGRELYAVQRLSAPGGKIRVDMTAARDFQSTTSLRNEVTFDVNVDPKTNKWGKFWRGAAIFFGVAAAGAAATSSD